MIPSGVKVFLASHPIDFRKGPDSLLSLVRDAGSDPFNGALYSFGRNEQTGSKSYGGMARASAFMPNGWGKLSSAGHSRVQLNHAQLLALVDGMDWKRVRRRQSSLPRLLGKTTAAK